MKSSAISMKIFFNWFSLGAFLMRLGKRRSIIPFLFRQIVHRGPSHLAKSGIGCAFFGRWYLYWVTGNLPSHSGYLQCHFTTSLSFSSESSSSSTSSSFSSSSLLSLSESSSSSDSLSSPAGTLLRIGHLFPCKCVCSSYFRPNVFLQYWHYGIVWPIKCTK